MSTSKNSRQRWLPLALVPMFSVAVLVGCGSDDDDPVITDPGGDTGGVVVGDGDGSGVADAFETTDATADTNGNGIADVYETPADDTVEAADTNENDVDDSFEASLSGGDDADSDGVDDAAAAAIAGSGDTDGGDTDGGDTDGGDTDGGDTDGGDTDGGDTGGGETVPGALNEVSLGDVGAANLVWDGSALTGQVDIADGVSAVGAAIYTGIAASGSGQQAVALNPGGAAATYFVPTGLAADQAAMISDNISSGNLYILVDLADGTQSQPGIILVDGVQPKYTELLAGNSVPSVDAGTKGQGYMNLNTATGEFTAAINIQLDPSDLDADGNPQTITAAHIHQGGSAETGDVIVALEDGGNGTTWTATGTFSTEDLSSVLQGNAYFNAHATDGSGFIRGQIPASQ